MLAKDVLNMTGKEFLKEIRLLDVELKSIRERIKTLEADAECLRSMQLSDMPKGGQPRTVADIISDVIDYQQKYAYKVDEINEVKRLAESCIAQVEHTEHRAVLRLRYLSCLSWEQVAEAMEYTTRWVFKLHGQALQEFDKYFKTLCRK